MLDIQDEFEKACLIDSGQEYQYHMLLKKLFPAYRELKSKCEDLKEWNKTLQRQLDRYKEIKTKDEPCRTRLMWNGRRLSRLFGRFCENEITRNR